MRLDISALFKNIDARYKESIEAIFVKMTFFVMILHLIDMAESYWYGYTASLIWEIMRIAAVLVILIPSKMLGVGNGHVVGHTVIAAPLIFLYGTMWLPDENYFYTLPWLIFILIAPFWFFDMETSKKWAIVQISMMATLAILSLVGIVHTLYNTSLLFQMTGTLIVIAIILYKIEQKRDLYKHSIQELAEENALLYDELQHRTRNNLQVLIGIFEQEHTAQTTKECKDLLSKLTKRIRTFDTINIVGANQDEGNVNLAETVQKIIQMYRDDSQCRWDADLDAVILPLKQANYLALIVNELLNNVQKHACPAGADRVELLLKRQSDGTVVLTVRDNGKMSQNVSVPNTTRIGTQLIERLVSALPQGRYETASNEGWEATVEFKA
jgi:two-component sensor histidine kinase